MHASAYLSYCTASQPFVYISASPETESSVSLSLYYQSHHRSFVFVSGPPLNQLSSSIGSDFICRELSIFLLFFLSRNCFFYCIFRSAVEFAMPTSSASTSKEERETLSLQPLLLTDTESLRSSSLRSSSMSVQSSLPLPFLVLKNVAYRCNTFYLLF